MCMCVYICLCVWVWKKRECLWLCVQVELTSCLNFVSYATQFTIGNNSASKTTNKSNNSYSLFIYKIVSFIVYTTREIGNRIILVFKYSCRKIYVRISICYFLLFHSTYCLFGSISHESTYELVRINGWPYWAVCRRDTLFCVSKKKGTLSFPFHVYLHAK